MSQWIIPKQLHTLASVVDTGALISDLNEQSQVCEQLLLVRSKPSRWQTWSLKWSRELWTQHLSGRILKLSHGPAFEITWISSLGDTRANHSAVQENGGGGKTQGISGPIYQAAFGFFDQHSASLKTSKATLPKGCITSCQTWESWVTEQRGDYSQRLNAVRLTQGNGSSFWPSVVASEVRQGFQDRSRGMKGSQESLTTVVMKGWPTPNAADSEQGGMTQGNRKDPNLSIAVHGLPAQESSSMDGSRRELWGTPRSSIRAEMKHSVDRGKSNLEEQAGSSIKGGGRLNPRWVETLMGLPIGWTMPSCTSPVTIAPMNSDSSGMV